MTTYVVGMTRGGVWSANFTNEMFQTLCGQVKDALDGIGLVQTSDTGQIDPATVLVPSSTNSDGGYFIYRFADSEQGIDPIFLKIYLGKGTAHYFSRLRLEIGQGSDGNGNLTGNVSSTYTIGHTYESGSFAEPSCSIYACHQEGYLGFAYAAIPDGYNKPPRHYFTLQRMRNQSTGAFDQSGWILVRCPAADVFDDPPSAIPYFHAIAGTQYGGDGQYEYGQPISGTDQDVSGNFIAWPHIYFDNGVVKTMWATWFARGTAFPNGAYTFNASPYGVERTWLSLGSDTGRGMKGTGTDSSYNWVMPMLWEA